jgi:tetratricopeptide (TPR) repeat protein
VSGLRHAIDQIDPGETYIETVPKRGYRLISNVEPINVSSDQSVVAYVRPQKLPKLVIVAVPILLLIGILLAVAIWEFDDEADRFDRIAIEPIRVTEEDPSSKALAQRLQSAIIRELTLGGVQVVQKSEGGGAVLRLSSSITRVGPDEVVTVQVSDGRSSETLWSRQFEMKGDIDNIVGNHIPWIIGDVISCGVLGNNVKGEPLSDTKLVGHFIRACNQLRSEGNFENLLVQSRKALALSPENQAAKARLAIAAAWLAWQTTSPQERLRLTELSQQASAQLISADPDYGLARYAKGIADWSAKDWASARKELLTAHKLSPEYPYTLNALSNVTADLGYSREAFDLKRQAVITDRFSLIQQEQLALMLAERGRFSEALTIAQKLETLDPPSACRTTFSLHHWWGNAVTALAIVESGCLSGKLSKEEERCVRAFLNFRLDRASPGTAFGACRDEAPYPSDRYAVATGFIEDAFSIALTSDVNGIHPVYLFRDDMRPLWEDPRIMRIAARYRLTRSWLDTNEWPDFCYDSELTYDCRIAAENAEQEVI